MLTLAPFIIIAIIIPIIILVLNIIISEKSNISQEKITPFECGFDPKDSARLPISIRFFLSVISNLVLYNF